MAETAVYIGYQIAIAVAVSTAMQALTPTPTAQGPRLNDRKLQTSTEGVPVPTVYGDTRIAGSLIDGDPEFTEVSTTENQGGKGGGGVDVTTYSYYATVAVRLCNGPIAGIRRLWADTELIFDASELGTSKFEPVYEGSTVVGMTTGNVTLYLGNQTQADPTLEALHGVGNVPAYIEEAYLVFNRFDVTKWGRFPNITAEVMSQAELRDPLTVYEPTAFEARSCYVERTRRLHYVRSGQLHTRHADGTVTAVGSGLAGPVSWDEYNDSVIARMGNDIVAVDPDTGALRGAWRALNFDGELGEDQLRDIVCDRKRAYMLVWQTHTPTGSAAYTVQRVQRIDLETGLRSWRNVLTSYNTAYANPGSQYTTRIAVDATTRRVVVGRVGNSGGEYGWTAHVDVLNAESLTDEYFTVDLGPGTLDTVSAEQGVAVALVNELTPSALGPGSIHSIQLSTLAAAKVADLTGYRGRALDIDIARGRAYVTATKISSLSLWLLTSNGVSPELGTGVIDLHTGQATLKALEGLGTDANQVEYYDVHHDLAGGALHTPGWKLVLERYAPTAPQLTDIVADLLGRAAVPADRVSYDIDDIEVIGYLRDNVMAARDALQPLCTAYGVDVIDVGYGIKVRSRGHAPVATVYERDLLALEGSEESVIEVALAQQSELPAKININYSDRSTDFSPASQPAQRRLLPSATVSTLELPIVYDGNSQPRFTADRVMTELHMGSRTYRLVLPLDYIELEPGDAFTLVLDDGGTRVLMIDRLEFSFDALALIVDASTYDPSIYGAMPVQLETLPPGLRERAQTHLQMLELPALTDSDASAPVAYAVAQPYIRDGWQSSALYRSIDGGITNSYVSALAQGVVGVCVTALPAGRQACYTDRTSTLRVALPRGGQLSSTTRAQLLNGANAAAIVRADGLVEVIQYQTATLQGDGSYVLSNLLNGRLGTEFAMDGHTEGATFVLLRSTALTRQVLETVELGAPRSYSALVAGQALADAVQVPFTPSGRNLKPYSPVRLRGTRDELGHLTISWTRRSRLRGSWRTGNWSPLGEAAEAYEVDILDGAGAVVRTLQSILPTVIYSVAEQVADFGSAQAYVATRVYQLSAAVGRGFPAEGTL